MPSPTPPTSNAASNRRRIWWGITGLALLIFAAYANTFQVPFVYDDTSAIGENPSIRQLSALSDILLPQRQGGLTVSGRPVLNLSLALNYSISGLEPWSYHALNLLIHLGNGLLLFGLVRRTIMAFRPQWEADRTLGLALTAAAFWALHPIQTQAVTYTVQRAESLMAFFYLLTFYAFLRAATTPSSTLKWQVFAVLACLFGMATKEVMASAPLLIVLYDRTFLAGSFVEGWRKRWGIYLGLAAGWLLLGLLVASTGFNRGGTVGAGVGVPWWAYGLTQFQAVVRYLMLAAWPHPLIFEYGTFWVKKAAEILPYVLVLIPLLLGTIWALWRRPFFGFFGAWFFTILAPTSLTPGTIQMIVEHRPYLPLAAVMVLAAAGLFAGLGRRAQPLGLTIAIGLALLTFERNAQYRSEISLWSDTVAKRPNNARAHAGLANAYEAAGDLERTIAERKEAIRLMPDEGTYHFNLGVALNAVGRREEALIAYRMAARLDPGLPSVHNNLAIALAETGDLTGAIEHYAAAEKLRPKDAQLYFNHGLSLYRLGRWDEAIALYDRARALRPDWADVELNLGAAHAAAHRFPEATTHYAQAARLAPNNAETRVAYGDILLAAGNAREATKEFAAARALAPNLTAALLGYARATEVTGNATEALGYYDALANREPSNATIHYERGNLLLKLDRLADAAAAYRSALRLNPNDAEAHHNLGAALARSEKYEEARVEFEAALRLKPNYPAAQRNLEQVRRLLSR